MGLVDLFKKPTESRTALVQARGKPFKQKMSKKDMREWVKTSTASIPVTKDMIIDQSKFKAAFFDLLLSVPIVSAAVWTWKYICLTENHPVYVGGEDDDQLRAKSVITALSKRISPFPFTKGNGFDLILDQYFQSIFHKGRFAMKINLTPDFDQISGVTLIDPFSVYFKKAIPPNQIQAFVGLPNNPTEAVETNPRTFFYHGLNMSLSNPYGSAMLEGATGLISIAEEMLQDMRMSSHNAGLPRLHIKVKQPQILPSETIEKYESRANSYFNNTVDEMAEIGPDDNFYTWDDVEIAFVGGQSSLTSTGFVWQTNREMVIEDTIQSFHLFPWILGRSSSTTKNWVSSQFDLLLNQADSLQRIAAQMIEWICNTELLLNGIDKVKAQFNFSRPRDPSAKDFAIAERFKIQNVDTMINKGYISPDDGARRLGLDRMYDPDRIYATQRIDETEKEAKERERREIGKELEEEE